MTAGDGETLDGTTSSLIVAVLVASAVEYVPA